MAGELVDALRIQQQVNVSAQGSTSQGCASWFSFICPHSSHYIYIILYFIIIYIYLFIYYIIYIYIMLWDMVIYNSNMIKHIKSIRIGIHLSNPFIWIRLRRTLLDLDSERRLKAQDAAPRYRWGRYHQYHRKVRRMISMINGRSSGSNLWRYVSTI